MQYVCSAIVLKGIRYQEKSLIVKCYTENFGLVSYFIKNAFSKTLKTKSAYFQPLSLVEITGNFKGKNTLEHISEIRLLHPYQTLATDFQKNAMVLFLSEILHLSLQNQDTNQKLYQFLETSLLWLDTHEFQANFHLEFLLNFTKYLGFYPDVLHTEKYFYPQEGIFVPDFIEGCLSADETELILQLIKFTKTKTNPFNQNQRRILLDLLLIYYQIHLPEFKSLNSLEVLKQIFS